MSGGIPIVGATNRPDRPLAPAAPRPPAQTDFADQLGRASAAPPPEVSAEVQAAARAADRLHQLGRELRFEREQGSGRIRIEVRDLDGNVLRRVPPGEVFDFAAGWTVE